MNSIRVSDVLRRVWLEVAIVSKDDVAGVTVAAKMFDGTPFSICVPPHSVEIDPCESNKGLLEVGYMGEGSGYAEITLPAPSLVYGHQMRVLANQLVHNTPATVYPTKYKK